VAAASAATAAPVDDPSPRKSFDLEGHRGARGLAPENTLAAFARALGIGVTTLELDLEVTRDGAIVVGHDPRLRGDIVRGPDGKWLEDPGPAVFSRSLAELGRYDVGRLRPGTAYAARFPDQVPVDGERMPELREVFALADRAANRTVRFNIEIKTDPRDPAATPSPEAFADAVIALVRAAGLGSRVTLQSFDWRGLTRARVQAPEIERSCLTIQQLGEDTVGAGVPGPKVWLGGLDPARFAGSVPRLAQAAGCAVWSPDDRDVTKAALTEAHRLGLLVLPWTVNEPADMSRLIELGVDGIITDRPDRLRAVMTAAGLVLPPATPVKP
jgi:glycerophosphoryl diester phosphodiesterase